MQQPSLSLVYGEYLDARDDLHRWQHQKHYCTECKHVPFSACAVPLALPLSKSMSTDSMGGPLVYTILVKHL